MNPNQPSGLAIAIILFFLLWFCWYVGVLMMIGTVQLRWA
jgi:hypothetical protein